MSLARDTRVGLVLTAAFCLLFGFVVLKRLKHTPAAAEAVATAESSSEPSESAGRVEVVQRTSNDEPPPAPSTAENLSLPPSLVQTTPLDEADVASIDAAETDPERADIEMVLVPAETSSPEQDGLPWQDEPPAPSTEAVAVTTPANEPQELDPGADLALDLTEDTQPSAAQLPNETLAAVDEPANAEPPEAAGPLLEPLVVSAAQPSDNQPTDRTSGNAEPQSELVPDQHSPYQDVWHADTVDAPPVAASTTIEVGQADSASSLPEQDVDVDDAKASPPPPAADRTYRVRKGDTLWTIARRFLGRGSRWRELYELNRDVLPDPNRLVPGTVLKLPPELTAASEGDNTRR